MDISETRRWCRMVAVPFEVELFPSAGAPLAARVDTHAVLVVVVVTRHRLRE